MTPAITRQREKSALSPCLDRAKPRARLKIFKQERSSFLKKRTKKLSLLSALVPPPQAQCSKSFLLRGPHGLFFKNEALPS
jgi:hypothetical protein